MKRELKQAAIVTLFFISIIITIYSCSKKNDKSVEDTKTLVFNQEQDLLFSKRKIVEEKCKKILENLPTSKILAMKDTISSAWASYFQTLIIEGTHASKMNREDLVNYTYRINDILDALDAVHKDEVVALPNPTTPNPCDFCSAAANVPPNAPCPFICSAYRLCCLSNAGLFHYNPATNRCEPADSFPCWDCAECNIEHAVCYAGCIFITPPQKPLPNFINITTGLKIKE